jgi:flagellin-like protein
MIMSGLEIIGAVMLVAMIVVIGGGLYAHRA